MRKIYASDISREKVAEVEPLLRSVRRRTKPTAVESVRGVLCSAVLCLLGTGGQWCFLLSEFPEWRTVHS